MESTLNTSQYRSLALDITAKDVSYLIYGSDQAIESGTITLDGTSGDYRKAIENAVYDNPFLLNDYQRITISLHARHFLIIPQEIEHLARKMMESSFTKIEGDILTCHIADTSASVACDVETGVEAFLRRTFPTSLILHHLAPLATYCARAYGEDTACMHVAIDNEDVHIVVIKHGKLMMATTANNHLNKLKAVLRMAYEEGLLREDIAKKLVRPKGHGNKREYLTREELVSLAKAECKSDVLRRAGLFSCLTGLRLSDCILLRWENVKKSNDGWVLDITTKKTGTEAVLPISDEALSLCGDRGEGRVFEGLTPSVVALNLKDWVKNAGITKHITFHCFRHTFATLQLAGGTDIYTVSKLLTHSSLATTQVYADVVNELKRDAASRISLKDDAT